MISEKYTKLFCKEDPSLIENYEEAIKDKNETWHIHHKNEIILNKSRQELIDLNLYYNRPASELIFLKKVEHLTLHHQFNRIWKGKKFSEEHKYNMRHKRKPMSEEHKQKIREANKGKHSYLKLVNPFIRKPGDKHTEPLF